MTVQESYSLFYNANAVEQVAVNLFYGWGYNFYRLENQLRQDDQRVRTGVCSLLNSAKQIIDTADGDFRRKHLRPPTREQPEYDPDALMRAEVLQALSHAVNALESHIRALPVPENDRMTQRYRQEAGALKHLIEFDRRMVGQAGILLQGLEQNPSADSIYDNEVGIKTGLQAITRTISERQSYLL